MINNPPERDEIEQLIAEIVADNLAELLKIQPIDVEQN